MKKIIIVLLFVFINIVVYSQTVKMEVKYGTSDERFNQLMSFQNIFLETVKFNGANLNGKYYQVFVKEFKNGKWVQTDTLFDGSEIDFFKITGDSASFQFFAQIDNNELKLQLMTPPFNSKKLIYKTFPTNRDYALKDFLGDKKNAILPIGKSFYTFAIITPTIHKDGRGSYCEVAQSGKNPEELGTIYKIPHYFLVEIVLK